MGRYGSSDYDDMFYELDEFLKDHKPSELLKLVQDAVEWWEERTEQPEIVHCKECMHNGSFDTDCPIDWAGKDYCSFGERKDG